VPVMTRVSRAARLLLPADTDLPRRHWRWLWAAGALRLFIVLPAGAVLVGPYLFCRGFVAGADYLGEHCGDFYATCHNRDMWRSGWRRPLYSVPAPALSPERREERAGS
jgi:hypothetical protein